MHPHQSELLFTVVKREKDSKVYCTRLYDERGYAQPTSKQQRYSHEEEQQQLFAVTDDAFELSRNSYDQRMAREMK